MPDTPLRSHRPSLQAPDVSCAGVTDSCSVFSSLITVSSALSPLSALTALAKSSAHEISVLPTRIIMSPGSIPASADGQHSPTAVSTLLSDATSRPSVAASIPTVSPTGTRS